jgi:hypothetical protein
MFDDMHQTDYFQLTHIKLTAAEQVLEYVLSVLNDHYSFFVSIISSPHKIEKRNVLFAITVEQHLY